MKLEWVWEYLRLWLVRRGWLRPRMAKPVQHYYPYIEKRSMVVRGLPPAYKWEYNGGETVVSAMQDATTLAVWTYPTAEAAAKARERIKSVNQMYDMAIITAGERIGFINELRAEAGLEPLPLPLPAVAGLLNMKCGGVLISDWHSGPVVGTDRG